MTGSLIPWKTVALVAFEGDVPVTLCSAEPERLFDVFDDLGATQGARRNAVKNLRWELHPLEDAKRIFGEGLERRPQQPALLEREQFRAVRG